MNKTATLAHDEEMLREATADEASKDVIIKNLIEQNATAQDRIQQLEDQMEKIKQVNEWLKDRYKEEHTKYTNTADREETEALALKVQQGNNGKLKDELERMTDMEANMEQMAKTNQAKAAATDQLLDEGDKMKRKLMEMHEKDQALQRRNDELQATVVSVVSKDRDDQVQRIAQARAEPAQGNNDKLKDELERMTDMEANRE